MPANITTPFDEPSLLGVPVMRAAYSDRTAWLMSAMSELAYYQFEDNEKIAELAEEILQLTGVEAVQQRLESLMSGTLGGGNEETLRAILKAADFELIRVYNRSDTQAFLAKRIGDGDGMLVLSFRGTEMNPRDIHSDVDAKQHRKRS